MSIGAANTVVVSVTVLLAAFGSPVTGPTETVFVRGPAAAPGLSVSFNVNAADAPAARDAVQAVTVPDLPTAPLRAQPLAVVDQDTSVAFAGRTSARVTSAWAAAPWLVTVMV